MKRYRPKKEFVGVVPALRGARTPQQMRKILSARGSSISGSGISREVYDLGNAVLKITSKKDNKWEIAFWNVIKDTPDATYFAAILASDKDGRWLIQEKLVSIGGWAPDITKMIWRGKKLGVRDLHPDNYGRRKDGTPAICDYAYNNISYRI